MDILLNTENLFFEYNDETEECLPVKVLEDVNISIKSGEFVSILGHNGSGKSTLAKHFNAILQPTSGTVIIDNILTTNDDMIFEIRQQVGMVFQNPDNQLVATIVEEDVAFALENLGVEPLAIRERVDKALTDVGMIDYKEHAPHQLSGGQKQRVAIAGIIAMNPKCIVLDEPTAMLDPKGRKEVINIIKKLNKEHGTTILLITHFMEEAVISDRVIVIDKGKIILDDIPKIVFSNVEQLKSVGLDVPQVTELAFLLRREGIKIKNGILTVDEFLNEFSTLMEDSD